MATVAWVLAHDAMKRIADSLVGCGGYVTNERESRMSAYHACGVGECHNGRFVEGGA
jgi:hypothetical protein